MKKLLFAIATIVFSGATLLAPLPASALDRIGVTFTNGDMYVKEGLVNAGWNRMTGGVSIGNFSLSDTRMSIVDTGAPNPAVSIKEPGVGSQWQATYYGSGFTPATKALVSKLSNGQYRLLVLLSNGNVLMKDGPYNTGWWSGTVATSASDIMIGGDNIGVVTTGGTFEAKRLTPGQFSHPNNTPWVTESTNVTAAAMGGDMIAFKGSNNVVYAKQASLTTGWAFMYDNVSKIRTNGQRICVIKVGNYVECKQGGLSGTSVRVYDQASDVQLNEAGTRIAVLTATNNAYLLEGTLYGANSGWQFFGMGNIANIRLN